MLPDGSNDIAQAPRSLPTVPHRRAGNIHEWVRTAFPARVRLAAVSGIPARLAAAGGCAVLLMLLLLQGAFVALLGGGGAGMGCNLSDSLEAGAAAPDLTGEQTSNASAIIQVASDLRLPQQATVIAIATALQESSLRNLTQGKGDRDSIGLFQQRPSQGWGNTPASPNDQRSPAQRLRDPQYAATAFYAALQAVSGWEQMPLTVAAQTVQRSGHPTANTRWESLARQAVTAVGSGFSRAIPEDLEQPVSSLDCLGNGGDGLSNDSGTVLPAGFALPAETPASVSSAIGWALAQVGTPYHYGGDCTAAHSGVAAHQCDCFISRPDGLSGRTCRRSAHHQ
jgi:hypothetical protein